MPQKWWLELPNDSISCFSVLKLRQKNSFMSKKVDALNLGPKVRKKEQINYALKNGLIQLVVNALQKMFFLDLSSVFTNNLMNQVPFQVKN